MRTVPNIKCKRLKRDSPYIVPHGTFPILSEPWKTIRGAGDIDRDIMDVTIRGFMKIVLAGGSGQAGTALARFFHLEGHEVVVLSRKPRAASWRIVQWDAVSLDSWTSEVDGADVVINLAGRSVNCRYNDANRDAILQSRVKSTLLVGEAIRASVSPAPVWLQACTATIYAHRYDAPNDEYTGIPGSEEKDVPETWRFSTKVAESWEKATDGFELPHTRLVKMRMAMVMGPGRGGVFDVLAGLVRKRLGGVQGDGKQFVSWIHEKDFIRSVHWLIEKDGISGAVNVCSPNPLPNFDFMHGLRRACGVSIGLPATKWMLEIGAFFMKTETELILKSRRVIPARLQESGFVFLYPSWPEAAENLHAHWSSDH